MPIKRSRQNDREISESPSTTKSLQVPLETSFFATVSSLVPWIVVGIEKLIENLDITTCLAIFGVVFVGALYSIHVIALCYGTFHLHKVNEPDTFLPGVSIIKPIMGTDENLETNLASFFTAQYHQFELLFCFHSPEDVAVPVVKALIKRYPDVDATICFQEHEIGFNPKNNNMNPGYTTSKYPLVMISDSTIFTRPDGILDLAKRIMSQEKLGLITQIPFCMDRVGLANCFEQVFFGTAHAKMYLAGNFLGFNCPTGMSSIFKKAALEECGGMAAFKDYMAEDYFLGKLMAARGYKSGISNQPALQNSAATTFKSFANRVSRWAKLRIAMMPQVIFVEPLQDCFPAGIIFALSVYHLFNINIPMTIFLNFLFWIFMDYMIMRVMQNGPLTVSLVQFIGFWLFRELSSPVIFIKALMEPSVRWRNNIFHVKWGGKIRDRSSV
ncbi:Protein CBG08882 [Caenorhabditis briggsae]|uniref:ceramide glucosyltransferase n=2 Tax=Caenorhabditis briggsae TaxID=6238 RepID=A0AAE9A2H4_CAEBR|nr:Protein CBG08882 [Caenorhabditis briggsae]ULT85269.1 hypothetical protein L3Y34_013806 [Caenorhabditis briggsae]CAP28630.1 Protein CBG08882 [Caenorhabditis briggsae]